MKSVAIVGSGPMGIYLLQHLAKTPTPMKFVVFEAGTEAGVGMPYDPALNADYMLCNAFSREIPPIGITLLEWLKGQPERDLNEWELSTHDLSARAFYSRVLIGEYMHAQFLALCERARKVGHDVEVRMMSRVEDIVPGAKKTRVAVRRSSDGRIDELFDLVAITTGHQWSAHPSIDGVRMLSPWPYTNVTEARQNTFGILGSSLSAIDVVVALGHARGEFDESSDTVRWRPYDPAAELGITMVSHHGIMPEADFYYPYPYEPLVHITDDAVDAKIGEGADALLDRVFELLCREIDTADPHYLAQLGPSASTIEGFADAYFSHRREMGGLAAVKADLARARASQRDRKIIPHRYALLRGHEKFDRILRLLPEKEYRRFIDHLMPVFADCYAAVPHLSVARIIAMYDAGVLNLVATKSDAKFEKNENGRIAIATDQGQVDFEVLIDARGQSPGTLRELPFPRLKAGVANPKAALEAPFMLSLTGSNPAPIFCLSLPQLLERYPFSQGLVECDRLAGAAADQMSELLTAG